MRLRLYAFSVFLLLSLFSGMVEAASAATTGAATWVVSPHGPYTTIQQAIGKASDGDTILVKPGIYAGPLVVEKSVRLDGEDWPVIDGGGKEMVVSLAAPGAYFGGFVVRGSGSEPDRDHAGIVLKAPDIRVENNRLYDVLFGIFVAQADRAVVRGNDITSKAEYDIARKGDAIRIWYSQDVVIENNLVHEARDLVAWYSKNLVFRNNVVQNGRYGVHLMYSDNATISGNLVQNNAVGIYIMYSRQVNLLNNDIRRQRGPSGYALGFKDADNVLAQNNLLVDNRAGVFMDGTPYRPDSYARFENNIIAFNDIGVLLFSFVNRAEFRGNTLWENVQPTALQGSGKAGANIWEGNYWSDYTGFDADGDGFGDVPYRSDRFFEGLMDREPRLRALLFSPAAQAIEFASLSFPVIKPQPKLEDPRPSVIPREIPASARSQNSRLQSLNLAAAGGALLLVGIGMIILGVSGGRRMIKLDRNPINARTNSQSQVSDRGAEAPLVQVTGLTKCYGKVAVLKDISLEIYPGEALALWGENGAGKTTLLKAILGLVRFQGQVAVAGENVVRQGKQTRGKIGYVPQEAVFYDMSVGDTLAFYARLKKVSPQRIPPLLEGLGLLPHRDKPVPALSGGLKQRLALAVALLSDPPLLLLDEPTANLDARARKDYLGLLLQLRNEGKTILFASHRLDEVETLADRAVILNGGQRADELEPGRLRAHLAPQVVLTMWVPEGQRQQALDYLQDRGWEAHVNGRGTVIVQISAEDKVHALQCLGERGIIVQDFEIEGVNSAWN
ncbi:MAG TPA: nitrous oxide reductase family maturation protein NosD [Anaerolineales bacterium]|nr:nitrous oxide reductase family maturation protein NosD [Anaerolineales bacterium]